MYSFYGGSIFMPVFIMFRSLTFAQRGAWELERFGIFASVIKAPLRTTDMGCSYCIRISESRLKASLTVLKERGIAYGRVLRVGEDGEYREVEV
jgi:hypothetical protein